jgi:hypothetical protein
MMSSATRANDLNSDGVTTSMKRELQNSPTLITPLATKKQKKRDKKTIDHELKKLSGFNPPGGNEEVPMFPMKLANNKHPPSSTNTSTTSTGTRKSKRLEKKK